MKITALSGGVGAAKLLTGLREIQPAEDLTVVVNTGDDFQWMGLYVCPDLDTVTYTLAGEANPETGWGVMGDSFGCLERLQKLGAEAWFRIGDLDLATHLFRTDRLRGGCTLTQVTGEICSRYGAGCRILPMADSPIPTLVHTNEGILGFQDYFVRRRCVPSVSAFTYDGVDQARPAPGVLDALAEADGIVVCPSNPFISIGPILAVPGIRDAICRSSATVVAVSPVISGQAVKGPTATMLQQLGHDVSAAGVAALYADMLDVFILDRRDEILRGDISALGLSVVSAETWMDSARAKVDLARTVLETLR